ncbi:MAG: acyl-CoA dehydrogenase family protein [Phycisphaerae bacterium]
MPNFFTENEDIVFNFNTMDLAALAKITEEGYKFTQTFDYAPENAEDAIDNYRRILKMLGQLSAEFIAEQAEGVDKEGNHLLESGMVKYSEGITKDLDMLAKAQVMGFTLPYRFGGLNCPNLIYTMAIEMVSRADASLMNIFGLQGIAETINAFATEELKQRFLPPFSAGKITGAMVLTEPDAGSDLQAVKTRAYQDANGNWYLNGVKRFITNGCGDVLLVLARTEEDRNDGSGLSLLLCEKGPTVKIRRLEEKLGIHGSPTCEIFFDDTPCYLIGERRRGLVPYVMSLMNGARVGIAAQSLGIAEAAYAVARDYAHSRKQFGVAIEKLPAVRDLLMEMKIYTEAARALTYECSRVVEYERYYLWQTESGQGSVTDKDELKRMKDESRKFKRLAAMLTPMCKYYSSEMANKVAYDSIQVLGGSGYMKDYASERHFRDARITNIYEGTSQLQVVSAVRGVASGTAGKALDEFAGQSWPTEFADLLALLKQGSENLAQSMVVVKEKGVEYMDLYGKKIVDVACDLYLGYLFLQQARHSDRKKAVAQRFITTTASRIISNCQLIKSGDRSTMDQFGTIVGELSDDAA